VLTDGCVGADPALRKKEQEEASRYVGVKKIFWGGYRDTELKDDRDLIKKIEDVVDTVKPEVVFSHYTEDTHQDHRAAAHAAIAATRNIKEVLFYESPTDVDFVPDIFVDITDIINEKIKLLEIHASQVSKTHIESLRITEIAKSCANFRGVQGKVKYAEGFRGLRVLRTINDKTCL
jgi:LmbE family N-acetylglucosaminyl deacetylase